MKLTGWGMHPKIDAHVFTFNRLCGARSILRDYCEIIPHGNGRSYGDSALSERVINVRQYNYFLDFDEKLGLLHVQAGVLLSEILQVIVPRGWFLKVTPGSKLITIGGAIAGDIHGKNHHIEGCFSECVEEFTIMLADGRIKTCSKDSDSDLFRATCGGMGLTGLILDAKISLKKINSQYINQTTIKNKNLIETFAAFERCSDKAYSVAWIDCLAKGENLGKSILMYGDFANDGKLDYQEKKKLNLKFPFPSALLNSFTIKILNWLYYQRVSDGESRKVVNIDTFFYPLDAINNWNRIYGKNGFIQYQFILPKELSYSGLKEMLFEINNSKKGSFLAVLKLYGKANRNWLSFPIEGYSLALDFKMESGLFEFLEKLDQIVLKYKGRIYLAKDVRMSKKTFELGYIYAEKFRAYRKENNMWAKFQSLQSKRLGI